MISMKNSNTKIKRGFTNGRLAGSSLNIDQNNFNKLKSVEVSIEKK